MLGSVDEDDGDLFPVLVMELGVLVDVLQLPRNPQFVAHLLDDDLCVITQMTVGLADQSDEPVPGGLGCGATKRALMSAILARRRACAELTPNGC